jgi:hypothetical protein
LELLNYLTKLVSSVGVIFEHVERGCSGAKKDDVAAVSLRLCGGNGPLQRAPDVDAADFWSPQPLDAFGHFADQNRTSALICDDLSDAVELEAFVFTSGD